MCLSIRVHVIGECHLGLFFAYAFEYVHVCVYAYMRICVCACTCTHDTPGLTSRVTVMEYFWVFSREWSSDSYPNMHADIQKLTFLMYARPQIHAYTREVCQDSRGMSCQ